MPESRDRLTARKVMAADVINGNYYQQEGFEPNYLITPYGLRVSRARILGTVVDRYINDDESYGALTIDDGSATIRAKFFQDLDIMEGVEEGDVVEVMGKVKQYDGEIYINPELVVSRGPTYELMRALELKQVQDEWRDHVDTVKELQDADRSEDDIIEELKGAGLTEEETEAILAYLDMDDAFDTASAADGGAPAQQQAQTTATTQEAGDDEAPEDQDRRQAVLAVIDEKDEGEGAEYGDIQDGVDLDEDALEDVVNDLLSDGTCYEPRPGRIKRL